MNVMTSKIKGQKRVKFCLKEGREERLFLLFEFLL